MEKVILKTEVRKSAGKKIAKGLRTKGLVPAVVYKGGKEALKLQIDERAFNEILHTKAGGNVIITLKMHDAAKEKDRTVIIKEIQRGPIKGEVLHVDFYEISLTETLKVNVPVVPHGEAAGVKKDGGTLEHVMWEVQVECLPTAIPEKIEVDVSNLNIGDAIYVKNIVVPEGVKILNDPELIIMIVKPPHVEAPKEEVVAETAEPELIREKKEKEEEEGAAPEGEKKEAAAKEPKKEEKK